MSLQKQTKKVFKSIRDVLSAFYKVSTTADYNFKATELNKQNKVSIFIFNFYLCHATVRFLNVFPHFSLKAYYEIQYC